MANRLEHSAYATVTPKASEARAVDIINSIMSMFPLVGPTEVGPDTVAVRHSRATSHKLDILRLFNQKLAR